MLLTREQIQASTVAVETVSVPEWGGEVLVADMGGDARDAFERWCLDHSGAGFVGARATLASFAIVGADGERLFTPEDVGWLGKKSAAALDRVYAVASRLNRLTKKDVAELEKNSGGETSGASTSA